jgi:hypothetical protein
VTTLKECEDGLVEDLIQSVVDNGGEFSDFFLSELKKHFQPIVHDWMEKVDLDIEREDESRHVNERDLD